MTSCPSHLLRGHNTVAHRDMVTNPHYIGLSCLFYPTPGAEWGKAKLAVGSGQDQSVTGGQETGTLQEELAGVPLDVSRRTFPSVDFYFCF